MFECLDRLIYIAYPNLYKGEVVVVEKSFEENFDCHKVREFMKTLERYKYRAVVIYDIDNDKEYIVMIDGFNNLMNPATGEMLNIQNYSIIEWHTYLF